MKRNHAVAAAGAVAAVAIAVPVVGQSFGEDESESVPAQKVGVTVKCRQLPRNESSGAYDSTGEPV